MTHRTLKISLLTATLISVGALVGTAAAESPKGDPRSAIRGNHFLDENDIDHDGSVSVDEAIATAEKRFEKVDANHDGSVTPEEGRAAAQGRHPEGAKRAEAHLTRMFEKLDADKDGRLSASEIKRMPAKIFEEIDTNKDGGLTPSEMKTHAQARMTEHGKKFFERLDVTGDGKISVDEAIDAAKRRFERLDTNGDDIVTADEARQGRGHHQNGCGPGRHEGKKGKSSATRSRGTTA